MSLQDTAFSSLGSISWSGTPGSYGTCMFNVLKNLHIFPIAVAPLCIPNNSAQGLQFLHIVVNTCSVSFFFFLIVSLLVGVKWYHTLVLICTSLILNNVEHLFMYLVLCVFFWFLCILGCFYLFIFIYLFLNILISLRVCTLLLLWSLGVLSYSSITSLWLQVSEGLSSPCGSQECAQGFPYPDIWTSSEVSNTESSSRSGGHPAGGRSSLLCPPVCGMEPSSPETLGSVLERSRDKGEQKSP